jgi:dUTP pyrophosphatase
VSAGVKVPVLRLPNGAGLPLPSYATPGSAGLDLMAAIERPLSMEPGERLVVPTGIAIALPAGFEAQVRPRSGLAWEHGVTVLNAPGTVDSDYRGELQVLLINHGAKTVTITRGQRVAQLLVAPVARVLWQEQAELVKSKRGAGGFGSTGSAAANSNKS